MSLNESSNSDPSRFCLVSNTRQNLNSTDTIIDSHHQFYLYDHSSYPNVTNKDRNIDIFSFMFFLSTFDNKNFRATHESNQTIKFQGTVLNHRMIIHEKNSSKALFKIRFNSTGTKCTIQIIGTSDLVKYNQTQIKTQNYTINAYVYGNEIIKSNLAQNKFKIKNNIFLSTISHIFNSSSNPSSFASVLFYSISPKSPKVQKQEWRKYLNPDGSLEGVFEKLGGTLCIYKGYGNYHYSETPIIGFVWFHQHLETFMDLSTTIELDTSFKVLSPDVFCIPQMIFRNTGIPLALVVGPRESADLYSLFFEGLKKLHPNNLIFNEFVQKNYLTDQHTSFKKLSKRYNLSIYHCLVHLIRNCGAKSALSLLIRDMLFCISEKAFKANRDKWQSIFNELTKDPKSHANNHSKLFYKILGKEVNGNIVRKQKYAPLYARIEHVIPTTTNHSESYHCYLNNTIPNRNTKLMTRVAMVAHKINERLSNLNDSIIRNFTEYVKDLRKKAHHDIELHPDNRDKHSLLECDCENSLYYSLLYGTSAPCIHTILNEFWEEKSSVKKWFEGKEIILGDIQTNLNIISIDEVLEFKEDENFLKKTTAIPDKIDIIDKTKYSDKNAQIIYECHCELSNVMSIDEYEVSSIAMIVQEKLLKEQKNISLKEKFPEKYYAKMHVKIWKEAYIAKKMIDSF